MGRKPIGGRAMTDIERQRRRREKIEKAFERLDEALGELIVAAKDRHKNKLREAYNAVQNMGDRHTCTAKHCGILLDTIGSVDFDPRAPGGSYSLRKTTTVKEWNKRANLLER